MLTFLVLNMADTKQKLGNDVFQAAGVAQKYNCSLVRLDYQQEQGLVSSLPLGINQIKIQRSLTTSNVAVFVCGRLPSPHRWKRRGRHRGCGRHLPAKWQMWLMINLFM